MKWFKHFSDAYTNLKLQSVLAKYGPEGYGFYWIVLEMVAQQGENFRINAKKDWKTTLNYVSRFKEEKIQELLDVYAEKDLIDKKALDKGDLYIPKMREYSDEYTAKLRSKSRHNRDNVGLEGEEEGEEEKNRTEEIRITPSQETKDFFSNSVKQEEIIKGLLEKGFNENWVRQEIKKFINHWTEKTKSGKFEKWEKQETFEVGRRLTTWFNNAIKWQKDSSHKSQERVVKI